MKPMLQLSKERKIILLVGSILLAAGILYRFSSSLTQFGSGEEIAVKQKAISKYQHSLHEKKELAQSLFELEKQIKRAEAVLIKRETVSLAMVDVQNRLQKIAGRAGVEIRTMRILKPQKTDDNNYQTVPVQCSFKGSMRQLKEIMYQIEDSSVLLRISDLRLKSINQDGATDLVQATVKVEGYMPVPPSLEEK